MEVKFDPSSPEERRRVRRLLDAYDSLLEEVPELSDVELMPSAPSEGDDESAIRDILAMTTGRELVQAAYRLFGLEQFTIHDFVDRGGVSLHAEPMRRAHSLIALLGRSESHRSIKILERHGGQPMRLSVRPAVARLIDANPGVHE